MKKQELQEQELNGILDLTDSIINKKYLSFLTNAETYQVCNLTMNDLAFDISKHIRVFHLKKFVYDSNENFLNKLISVVNVAYALKGTIITSIQSSGDGIDFYIGIAAKEKKGKAGEKDRQALLNAFEGTIAGNFCGSDISSSLKNQELAAFHNAIDGNAICSVSVVPSLRAGEQSELKSYVQGIENLVDSLKGKKYTLLTIADPIPASDISEIRHGYETIYNYLAPLYKVVKTEGSSDSLTLSRTDTENYVKGITEGIARTQSRSESTSYSNGFNLGVSFILSAGFQHGRTQTTANTDGITQTTGRSEQYGTARAKSVGSGHTTSESTQINVENRMIKSMLDKIEKNMERIEECEGYGAFNAATYILADDKETALNAAGNFASLMKGERSCAQSSAINCWENTDSPFPKLLNCLKHFLHPKFKVNDQISVSASAVVSGPELTVQLGFPKKSVHGLTVLPMHSFGRNVSSGKTMLPLGRLYFMGQTEQQSVGLDINSLAAHVFVTGSTGSGKSNAIYGILDHLSQHKVSFMVVEPAKGEYKNVFGARTDVRVLGTNHKKTELLKINPFSFHEDIHVLEHIDRLLEIFNVCWSMYAAMPAVLKEAMEEAYLSCGWDLDTSENRFGQAVFPTFSDLQKALQVVIERSAYDNEVKSNYKGSLLTRVRSLANGLNRRIFCTDEIPDNELFDSNVIIDLSRVGSMETKSFFMGILVMKLQEYRMSQAGINSDLQHVTVLEEAHNLLRKTSAEPSAEGSNMIGKSVEMITNAIAEMRTYGEGFIIADQAPGLLDRSVIRNTNTKIILRTPEYSDRQLAGKAAGLDDGQIEELAKLPLGVAAVYQNNWTEPVLCQLDRYEYEESYRYEKVHKDDDSGMKKAKTELVKWLLMNRVQENIYPDFESIEKWIDVIPMAAPDRLNIKQRLNAEDRNSSWENVTFEQLSDLVVEILSCRKEIRCLLEPVENTRDMQKVMDGFQADLLEDDISDKIRLEVNHCFMKVYSRDGNDELKKYYNWDFQVRNHLF